MLFKGILGVDRLINVTANTTSFFFTSSFSEVFFPKSCLKVGGAAYTQVFTVYPTCKCTCTGLKVNFVSTCNVL